MKSDKALWGSISILVGAVIAILALKGCLAVLAPDRGIHPLGAVGHSGTLTALHAAGKTPQNA